MQESLVFQYMDEKTGTMEWRGTHGQQFTEEEDPLPLSVIFNNSTIEQ